MRIGLEARWITQKKTGFGNYTLNLLRELGKIDRKNEYVIYLNKDFEHDEIFSKSNFSKRIIKRRPEYYKHVSIPLDIIRNNEKIDLFHFAYNAPSLFTPCPFVLTIHDVSYKRIKNMLSFKNRISLSFQLAIKAKKAKKIIAVSETSKKDIIKYFRVAEHKIDVIYEAVNENFRPKKGNYAAEKVRTKYSLPNRFLLYVGTYMPHKNLDTLLKAYKLLRESVPNVPSLVFAGKKGRNYTKISKAVTELGLNQYIKKVGFVDDDDLPYLYNLSEIFIFPSLYEGFGLPLLEAMQCETPIISASSSCLPEIGGDAAVYFDSYDEKDLKEKIVTVLNNRNLQKVLVEKGIKRARFFSWRKMAEKTLCIYENAYNESHKK